MTAESARSAHQAATGATHSGAPILLVDDDKFLLDMYSMKFSQQGYAVQAFLSGTEALDALRSGFRPDAIVFDLLMPGLDGFALLQAIQSEKLAPGSKKIALTNQSTDAEKEKVKEMGADEFIVKATMIPSEVVNTIERVLGRGGKA